MNPKERAEDIVAHLMEYTPDWLINDNKCAYTICVTHAIIMASLIQDYAFEKSYWQDVIDILKELEQSIPLA